MPWGKTQKGPPRKRLINMRNCITPRRETQLGGGRECGQASCSESGGKRSGAGTVCLVSFHHLSAATPTPTAFSTVPVGSCLWTDVTEQGRGMRSKLLSTTKTDSRQKTKQSSEKYRCWALKGQSNSLSIIRRQGREGSREVREGIDKRRITWWLRRLSVAASALYP